MKIDSSTAPAGASSSARPRPREREQMRRAMLSFAARLGITTAGALAVELGVSHASASARLAAAARAGLLTACRPLHGRPTLYAATAAGIRASGESGLGVCTVSVANAEHLIACAEVAAALRRLCPELTIAGERELRRDEERCGGPLASARLPGDGPQRPRLHRPDLVLWPAAATASAGALPVAVEVELTAKGSRRLQGICRAWARSRLLGGVIYLAPPKLHPLLQRSIAAVGAGERIALIPLSALLGGR